MSELDHRTNRLLVERDAARDRVNYLQNEVDDLNCEIHDLKQQKQILTDDRTSARKQAEFDRELLIGQYDSKFKELESQRDLGRWTGAFGVVLAVSAMVVALCLVNEPRTLKLDLKDGTTYFVQYGEQVEIYVGEEQEVSE